MMVFKNKKKSHKNKGEKHNSEVGNEEQAPVIDDVTQVDEASAAAETSESKLPSQREAVFSEVMRVLAEDGIDYDSTQAVKPILKEESLKKIYAGLAAGFQANAIALKATPENQKKLAEPKLLEVYIVGLVANWLRRDTRLNGKSEAKV